MPAPATKTTATEAAALSCAGCGWHATGHTECLQVDEHGTITGGHLIIDPTATAGHDQPQPDTNQPATPERTNEHEQGGRR